MNNRQQRFLVAIVGAVSFKTNIGDGPYTWQEMVTLAEGLGFNPDKVKNRWFYIRDLVATAQANNLIERTSNLHAEEYVAGTAKLADFGI